MGLMKWIKAVRIEGLAQIHLIQQLIIQIKPDIIFRPVHLPNVKFFRPSRVFVQEMGKRNSSLIPSSPFALMGPSGVGQDRRCSFDQVIFHDIYLPIGRPALGYTQGPYCRPHARRRIYTGPYFHDAILESFFPLVWMLAAVYSANSVFLLQSSLDGSKNSFFTFSRFPSITKRPSLTLAFSG